MLAEMRAGLIVLALASCAVVLAFTGGSAGHNPMSRLATMDALVHDHTWVINKSVFRSTYDKVSIDGKLYSSKPPMLSSIGTVLYKQLHEITGLSFRDKTKGHAIKVMNILLAGVPHVLLLIYAYLFLASLQLSPQTLMWSYACFAFGRLGLAYAVSINNHTPAELCGFAAFYHASCLRRGLSTNRWHWVGAGLAAGFAPTFDLGMLFCSSALGLYLLSFDWRKTLLLFVPASLPPMAAHFALTWSVSGALKPIYLRPELYKYPGSYWNAPKGIDALDEPRLTYLYNIMLGHHGLISMTPVIAFALWAMCRAIWKRTQFLPEALTVFVPLVIMTVFYTLTTKNYGGVCVGFRWLMPITSLLLAFVPIWLANNRSRIAYGVFVLAAFVGQFHAFHGLHDPWSPSQWSRWLAGS
jgi:hypothetical protein